MFLNKYPVFVGSSCAGYVLSSSWGAGSPAHGACANARKTQIRALCYGQVLVILGFCAAVMAVSLGFSLNSLGLGCRAKTRA